MTLAAQAVNVSAIFAAGMADRILRHLENAIEECLAALIAWLVSLVGVPS